MIVHADNFNMYGTDVGNALDGVYANLSPGFGGGFVTDPDGTTPTRCLMINAEGEARYVLGNPTAKVGIAQRLWLATLPYNDDQQVLPCTWRSSTNDILAYIQVTNTGSIKAFVRNVLNTAFVLVGDTVAPVVTAAGWYHIEAYFKAGLTGAEVEVRVEGVPVITQTGLTTFAATIYSTAEKSVPQVGGAGPTVYYKDLVIWDGTGTANNDFLGAVLVKEMAPTTDVSAGGWTSTGASVSAVLNGAAPSDTSYIAADDTPPAACTVNLSNLPADVTSVKAIVSMVRAGKVDGGDGKLQVSVLSGAASSDGADRPITAAQTYWRDIHELDPNTGLPWTPVAADAATLKINRTL